MSILPWSSILPCLPPVMLSIGGVQQEKGGSGRGEGGRGHFSPAAIYCTTTWCFALKGLSTVSGGTVQLGVGIK